MTSPVLKVDPKALQEAGSAFGAASGELGALAPDGPLNSAAAGVPQLATAAACRAAATGLAAEMSAVSQAAQEFGENLGSAASQYLAEDAASAGALQDVQFPS